MKILICVPYSEYDIRMNYCLMALKKLMSLRSWTWSLRWCTTRGQNPESLHRFESQLTATSWDVSRYGWCYRPPQSSADPSIAISHSTFDWSIWRKYFTEAFHIPHFTEAFHIQHFTEAFHIQHFTETFHIQHFTEEPHWRTTRKNPTKEPRKISRKNHGRIWRKHT